MNNNQGSRFFDGFLLGLIIGGLAVFLLGTKSGKQILKKLSEEGLSGIEDLVEKYEKAEESVEVDEDLDEKVETVESEPVTVEVKPKKRLFKRFRRVD